MFTELIAQIDEFGANYPKYGIVSLQWKCRCILFTNIQWSYSVCCVPSQNGVAKSLIEESQIEWSSLQNCD